MQTIGLIGGMSWESTATYYQVINETIRAQLGGLHSAKILLCSVDFYEIEVCQANGEWDKSAAILADAAQCLEKAGADFIVICTNTMHKVVPQIERYISIPILHIADATADALLMDSVHKVALLGTKYTMTQTFYKDRILAKGIDVLIPETDDMDTINRIIYEELCLGVISEQSKCEYLRIVDDLARSGAQAVILGCTEIGMLIKQNDTHIPLYDTAQIHAMKAALASLV